jgi:hypothetical protein
MVHTAHTRVTQLPATARLRALCAHTQQPAAVAAAEAAPEVAAASTVTKRSATVAVEGLDLHYDIYTPEATCGPAKPVLVMLHGAGGSAAIWWQNASHFARRGHTVLTPDARCYGRSRADMPAHYDPAKFSDDLLAILDQEGVDPGLPWDLRALPRATAATSEELQSILIGHLLLHLLVYLDILFIGPILNLVYMSKLVRPLNEHVRGLHAISGSAKRASKL